jgi:hypothetical protein
MKLKKLLIIVSFSLLINSSNAETIKPQNIIKFFDVCKINSSLGQMCKMDSFNSFEYFKGLDEVINDNVAHYKEGDFWEFFFTIEEQNGNQAIIMFEDIALRGSYKSAGLFKFKLDETKNIWSIHSVKEIYPKKDNEYKVISE